MIDRLTHAQQEKLAALVGESGIERGWVIVWDVPPTDPFQAPELGTIAAVIVDCSEEDWSLWDIGLSPTEITLPARAMRPPHSIAISAEDATWVVISRLEHIWAPLDRHPLGAA